MSAGFEAHPFGLFARLAALILLAVAGTLPARATSLTTLYSFRNGRDGGDPSTLTMLDGTLFGGTASGGYGHVGTLFAILPSGRFKVLHTFMNYSDGGRPTAALVPWNGLLYGTTTNDGPQLGGTAFAITHQGNLTTLHSFTANTADSPGYPQGNLTKVGQAFFGTSSRSGAQNNGTVYQMALDGSVTLLHSFAEEEGVYVGPGLVNVHGVLYGTAQEGGGPDNAGTLFKVNLQGETKVLHTFHGPDGAMPNGNLILVGDTLYGTTEVEGAHGCGTVFSATLPDAGAPSVLTTLYSFACRRDGALPDGGLTEVGGKLYGMTLEGGTLGRGTVFALTAPSVPGGAWTKTTVYAFGGSDGAEPRGELIEANGTLYGVTWKGGAHNHGTVFSLVP